MYLKDKLRTEIVQLGVDVASTHESTEQKTAEAIKNKERFAFAMQHTKAGLWDWDLQTGEVYYSPLWRTMLGYQDDELESNLNVWASIIHPEDKRFVLDKFRNYLSGITDSFNIDMRMAHRDGHYLFVTAIVQKEICKKTDKPIRLIGLCVDKSARRKSKLFHQRKTEILEMIAKGIESPKIYDEIALLYESHYSGLRCSMLELSENVLRHGGAPSLPKEYCDAVDGLKNGPDIASCGTATYTGKRVIVENIETDPKWTNYKHIAMPYGMRSCWSEPIKSSSGKILGAFGMYYDYPATPNEKESKSLADAAMLASIVMERDHNQKRIRDLAYIDELTGLSNRAHFHLMLNSLINKKQEFSLLYVDLDNFKDINDSLGYDTGDLYLKEIAQRLKNIISKSCSVARIAGDVFCIINKSCKPSSIAKQCLKVVSQPSTIYGRKFVQTCSIGIAQFPNDGKGLQELLKAAGTAIYEAKNNGRNNYYFYNRSLTKRVKYRFKIEQDLREAITQEKLSVAYQPLIDINSGEIIGVEALSRWNHPQLGEISPDDFIAIAERTGLIKLLTESVLKTACKQAVIWRESGLPTIRMAVNIPPNLFLDEDLLPLIESVINDTGIEAQNLKLEVTESVVQTQRKNISIFKKLKKLGVLIAIDDFGTGYSSFASLKHLNIDFLKIDKYFIDDMLIDEKSRILISSIIEMGHALGYRIIAEGIEKVEQLNILATLGCEIAQGFWFSKPVSAHFISTLLKDGPNKIIENESLNSVNIKRFNRIER